MDKMFKKGLSTIFFIIAVNAAQKFGVSLSTSHLDSSSMHVHGKYNTSLQEVIFESQKIGDNQELEEMTAKLPADSALYTESNLKTMSELSWLCRVPVSIVEYNNQKQVSNWTKDKDFILNLLPNDCLRYYRLVT
jgi:hypothetical protein